MVLVGADRDPDRRRRRDLPGGVRRPGPLVQPRDRGQHPEPRRRCPRSSTASSGWRSSCAASASAACCWPAALTLTLLVLPIVIIASREAIRAVPASIRQGALALGATQLADDPPPGAAGGDARHRDRLDPRALARDRRDRAADPDRRARRSCRSTPTGLDSAVHGAADPDLQLDRAAAGGVPRCSRPRRSSCCSYLLLAMNAFAIWLRNRYQRKW